MLIIVHNDFASSVLFCHRGNYPVQEFLDHLGTELEEGEGKGEGGFLPHHVKCGKVSVLYFTCGKDASHHF